MKAFAADPLLDVGALEAQDVRQVARGELAGDLLALRLLGHGLELDDPFGVGGVERLDGRLEGRQLLRREAHLQPQRHRARRRSGTGRTSSAAMQARDEREPASGVADDGPGHDISRLGRGGRVSVSRIVAGSGRRPGSPRHGVVWTPRPSAATMRRCRSCRLVRRSGSGGSWRPASSSSRRLALVVAHGFDGLYGQDAFGYVNFALGPLREALAHGAGVPAFEQPPGFPIVVAVISLVAGPDARIGLGVSLVAGALVPILTRPARGRGRRLQPHRSGGRRRAAAGGGRGRAARPALAVERGRDVGHAVDRAGDGRGLGRLPVRPDGPAALAAGRGGCSRRRRSTRAGSIGLVAVPIGIVALIGLRRTWARDRWAAVAAAPRARWSSGGRARPGRPADGSRAARRDRGPVRGRLRRLPLGPAQRLPHDLRHGRRPAGPRHPERPLLPRSARRAVLVRPARAAGHRRRRLDRPSGGSCGERPAGRLAGRRPRLPRRVAVPEHAVLPVGAAAGRDRRRARAVAAGRRASDSRRRRTVARIASPWAPSLLPSGSSGPLLVAGRFTDAFIVRQVADLAAIRSLEAQVPPGARLISMGPTGVFVRDGIPDVVELFGLDPASGRRLLADGQPSYLVIDPAAIDGQWAGRARPARSRRSGEPWAHPDRRAGAWTLYRIGSPRLSRQTTVSRQPPRRARAGLGEVDAVVPGARRNVIS